jgi:lambda repressor-like predicted transcriptional regulator
MDIKQKSSMILKRLKLAGHSYSSAAREFGCSTAHLREVALGVRRSPKIEQFLAGIMAASEGHGNNREKSPEA